MYLKKEGKYNHSLEVIAKEYYSKLNPKNKHTSTYKSSSIIDRIKKQIIKLERELSGSPRKGKKDKEILFFNRLLKDIEEIIIANPKKLSEIVDQYENFIKEEKIPPLYISSKTKITSTKFGKKILKTLNYSAYRSSAKFIWWSEQVDAPICLYCQYERLDKVSDVETETMKLLYQVDHFISKAKAPYLSISFFNLIPSCYSCNKTFKGEKQFHLTSHIHPYEDNFDDTKEFVLSKPIVDNDTNSFEIIFSCKNPTKKLIVKSDGNVRDLNLEKRYGLYKNEVLQLNTFVFSYPKEHIEMLVNPPPGMPSYDNKSTVIKNFAKIFHIPLNKHEASKMQCGKLKFDLLMGELKKSEVVKIINNNC